MTDIKLDFKETDPKRQAFAFQAISSLKAIVNDPAFSASVLKAPVSYRKLYTDSGTYKNVSNQEILDIILGGKEHKQPANMIIDLQVRLGVLRNGTVGSMTPPNPLITTNVNFFDPWMRDGKAVSLAAQWLHEWLHVAGFYHKHKNRVDPNDVNYTVGKIVTTIGAKQAQAAGMTKALAQSLGSGYLDAMKMFLAQEEVAGKKALAKNAARPARIIDVHSHFFNLKYLPVAGIIRRFSKKIVPHKVALGIEWLLLRKTSSDFETRTKAMVRRTADDTPLYVLAGEEKLKFRAKEVHGFDTSQWLKAMGDLATVDDVDGTPLEEALKEFIDLEEPVLKLREWDPAMSTAQKKAWARNVLDKLRKMLASVFEKIEHYPRWFIFMTNSEEQLFDHIVSKDEQGVEKYLHLMMDVDHFFNKPIGDNVYRSHFDFEKQQIPNMERLNKKHPKELVGFVAFNPARSNSLEVVKDAIRNRGFRGVKFYPPLGYRPYNDDPYKNEIAALMAYCATDKVPVFAHCNNMGFEASKHAGYDSSPVYWEQVLKQHPKLILCLAHGGGNEGWFTDNRQGDRLKAAEISARDIVDDSKDQEKNWNHSYAAMVFKLCAEYENVYCDAAYLDEMINADGSFEQKPRENFRDRLLALFREEPRFAKRIMYGSDWHMLFQEGKNNVYLENYIRFFEEAAFDAYRDDFFYNNAVRYLS